MALNIGIDFDNTLANYDQVIYEQAYQRQLIPEDIPRSKTIIRDAIRKQSDGELRWRNLQAVIYGERMSDAQLFTGAREFLVYCTGENFGLNVISHKTEYSTYDNQHINLRTAALQWMSDQGFFNEQDIRLTRNNIFFESTRRAKINRIKQLGIHVFIDDLEETFAEKSFPVDCLKILFNPHRRPGVPNTLSQCSSWTQITELLQAISPRLTLTG